MNLFHAFIPLAAENKNASPGDNNGASALTEIDPGGAYLN
jgi:hypothetical protein